MATLRMILIIIFLIAALAITVVVLMQEGKSAGLGSLGGAGNGESYWDKNKKHSLEGKFERWTKMMAGVFVLTAFILMFIPVKSSSNTEVVPPTTTQGEQNTTEGEGQTEEQAPSEDEAGNETAEPSETPAE